MPRIHSSFCLTAVLRASTIASITVAQPAFADDAKPPTPSTELGLVPEPADVTAPAISTDTGAIKVEEPAVARYPRSLIARPLTLPSGVGILGADATANHDFSAIGGAPIVGYGFTDDFEVLVPYSFSTKDFEAKGSVAVDAGYKLLRGAVGGKLEAIARARAGYNALDAVATPLTLGVHVQYNFTPTIALMSGYAGTQQLRISVADDATMAKPVDFGLPIALGYQPTRELYLQVDTKLATINIHDSANTLIGKDTTPAALTVVYNVINALDLQAALGTDLSKAPGDALTFLVGARYYAGQL